MSLFGGKLPDSDYINYIVAAACRVLAQYWTPLLTQKDGKDRQTEGAFKFGSGCRRKGLNGGRLHTADTRRKQKKPNGTAATT